MYRKTTKHDVNTEINKYYGIRSVLKDLKENTEVINKCTENKNL